MVVALVLVGMLGGGILIVAGSGQDDEAGASAPGERVTVPSDMIDGRGTVLGDQWSATPPKTDAYAAVVRDGGLWRLDVPDDAGGQVRVVSGRRPAPREADRRVSLEVRVEDGLGVDGQEFARQVMDTLNDPRGWGYDGSVVFARTDRDADFHVTLASPATTDALCAPVDTHGRVSCGRSGYAVINAERWAHGAEAFLDAGGEVGEYRRYVVNHEVGHVIGNGHVPCPAPGARAPVMLQQTLRLDGCVPNGWPSRDP